MCQLDCRILESTIFQAGAEESTWFLACRCRFKNVKDSL